jgi:2,4-dienoyl-CoA reductase-like NADH-dependent reductase (Old Yellow Enzyme family)
VSAHDTLFQSFQLGPKRLANRIVMAPMTRARAGADRIPNDLMAQYYAQRASAGLIVTEATTISEQANGWVRSPGIYTDPMQQGWQRVVDSVHEGGGKIFLQLWHCGRASHSDFHQGDLAVAPSAIKIDNGEQIHTPQGKKPHEVPRALETEEISAIVEDYRRASKRALEAGFDGVEIHSANGYLLDTFLQSKTNKRSDKYGGSVERRFQLLKEVVEAIGTVWPHQQVGVRIGPNGNFNDVGSPDFREQFSYVAERLNGYDLAYLHVMDGLGFGFHELGDPMTLAEFRTLFHGTLIGNVGYTKQSAAEQIGEGNTDLIAFGRPYISNPDLVERFRNDWPLNEEADMSVWYGDLGADGYTDFPAYDQADAADLVHQEGSSN